MHNFTTVRQDVIGLLLHPSKLKCFPLEKLSIPGLITAARSNENADKDYQHQYNLTHTNCFLIMPPRLHNNQRISFHAINKPMFAIDSLRPPAR